MTRPFSRRSCTTLMDEVPMSTPMTLFDSCLNSDEREKSIDNSITPCYARFSQNFLTWWYRRAPPSGWCGNLRWNSCNLYISKYRHFSPKGYCPTTTRGCRRWCGSLSTTARQGHGRLRERTLPTYCWRWRPKSLGPPSWCPYRCTKPAAASADI